MSASSACTPETIDLTGLWRLVAVTNWTNGVMTNPHAMGSRPGGYINYAPAEGRMMVVLDWRSVEPTAKSQFGHNAVVAYAGRFTRNGAKVTHHLEMCTNAEDVGGDYVRIIEVQGENLFLCTEPVTRGDKTYVSKLEWTRDMG